MSGFLNLKKSRRAAKTDWHYDDHINGHYRDLCLNPPLGWFLPALRGSTWYFTGVVAVFKPMRSSSILGVGRTLSGRMLRYDAST